MGTADRGRRLVRRADLRRDRPLRGVLRRRHVRLALLDPASGASTALGGTALTLELGGGVLGTLAGGRISARIGHVRTVQLGNALLVPALIALLACDNAYGALPLVLAVGLVANIPFAVLVKLGQDYLPTRPSTAAGVTFGLSVSVGGLFMPLLGLVADHSGPRGVFAVLAFIPLIAVAISTALHEPRQQPRRTPA
jgi:FSR family fosmidomycin resistance protein-like MFS transporter